MTDDEVLRERIQGLKDGEALILRGDRQNSLQTNQGKDKSKINNDLMTQHLTCIIIPHTDS